MCVDSLDFLFPPIPVFLDQPVSTAVLLDSDLILNCSARLSSSHDHDDTQAGVGFFSLPSHDHTLPNILDHQWYFNGTIVEISVAKALVFQNSSLYVPRVTEEDLGEYQCEVWEAGRRDTPGSLWSDIALVIEACK